MMLDKSFGDDAKKGEEDRRPVKRSTPTATETRTLPTTIVPRRLADYFTRPSLTSAAQEAKKDNLAEYGIPDDIQTRFKGWKNPNFTDSKTEEQRKLEGGIIRGIWMEPDAYTPNNLPLWCYDPTWDAVRREKYLIRRNQEKKDKREEEELAKKEKDSRIKAAYRLREKKINAF